MRKGTKGVYFLWSQGVVQSLPGAFSLV